MRYFKNFLSFIIGLVVGTSAPENPVSFEDQIIKILSNSKECYRRDIIDKALDGGVKPSALFPYLSKSEQQYIINNSSNAYSNISPYFLIVQLNVPSIMQEENTWCGAATIQIVLKYLNGSSPTQKEIVSSITDSPSIDAVTEYLNNRITDDNLKYTYKSIDVSEDFKGEITTRLSSALKYKKPMILQIANVDGTGQWRYKTSGHYCLCDGRTSDTYTICDPYYYRYYLPEIVGEEGHFIIKWDELEDGIKKWAEKGAKVGYTSY